MYPIWIIYMWLKWLGSEHSRSAHFSTYIFSQCHVESLRIQHIIIAAKEKTLIKNMLEK